MDQKRLEALNAYFRAANFLSVGQIYLRENTMLRKRLKPEHIKARLLGHWGTSPGLNLIYAHLNRLIQDTEAKCIYITGPGHGGPALRANVFLEGSMTETYPEITRDAHGIEILMREFSWPGGVPSHVSPPTPGSIHEGGELGYSLVHAFGAAFDNPDLIVACVVGDGEAETGPLAASWHSNKFLSPKRDGAVLPILHLNGYKISGPTIFGRMEKSHLQDFFVGCNYEPRFVEGDDPMDVHKQMWEALDWAYGKIRDLQAKEIGDEIPVWPMIILRTPKGWTGPKVVDGKKIEGTFRAHQVPLAEVVSNPEHLKILEDWIRSYEIEELFDEMGHPNEKVLSCVPKEPLRMGASPHTNGGLLLKELKLPDFREYAVDVPSPGEVLGEATRELGKYVRDIMKMNPDNFRLFCPDETNSNRFNNVFEVTGRMYLGKIFDSDDSLSHEGRVMEVLSEHLCQGWLEGYLLTGRYGIFPCYEAFAMIIDSMVNQHGKWLKACNELPWRKPIASLNYLLTSHAWRQDHNGYSHQGPGFIESILQKKADVARIYFPPDANCLLTMGNHCIKSKNYINLIVAGKQPMPQWLTMKEAEKHCASGISSWKWASNDKAIPDLIMASAGDVPTQELLASISILHREFPNLKIRMINVVDLFTLIPDSDHSHGLTESAFEKLFTKTTPVIFAFHGHPRVIHELIYKRANPERFHVHGYLEEGTTTTPFDMVVCNNMSRFHLAMNALSRAPHMATHAKKFNAMCEEKLKMHKTYIQEHGEDMPEIRNWKWGNGRVRKTA
ncbi:MAG: Xylulose-5-phosphate phosphoketolase [Chlamydiae bacterium]|nr:Xylulose-5-phosphate phosphoketolase [Chlamydiota bacterium]